MGLSWINATASRRNVRWFSNGLIFNPVSGTVLANTGPVNEPAEYHAYIIGSSTAAARISIDHRNATDTNIVGEPIVVLIGANTPIELFVPVRLAKGERLRVTNGSSFTGQIAFSIALVKAYQDDLAGRVVEDSGPDEGP